MKPAHTKKSQKRLNKGLRVWLFLRPFLFWPNTKNPIFTQQFSPAKNTAHPEDFLLNVPQQHSFLISDVQSAGSSNPTGQSNGAPVSLQDPGH